jgi:oligopeptide/dipeptide ABC transporter ATP-binding protein
MVMYLGRIVESGPVVEVFTNPSHPYTRALLDSVPSIDPARRDELKTLSGEIPSPLNRPDGCVFAPRCRFVTEACGVTAPELKSMGEGHQAACFHPLSNGAPAHDQ